MTETRERVIVRLRGVPLGHTWLGEGDLVFATLEPSVGYEGFIALLRAHSQRLWQLGFGRPDGARIAVEALAPAAELDFELLDHAGRSLVVDFVNVVAPPIDQDPIVVIVSRRYVQAAVASVLRGPAN